MSQYEKSMSQYEKRIIKLISSNTISERYFVAIGIP